MLYIENIDDCTFRMYGDLTTSAGVKILDKRNFVARGVEPQSAETQGRITIYNATLREKLLSLKPVTHINLDGVIYASAGTFCSAFNALMAECCCAGGGTSGDNTELIETINEAADRIIQSFVDNNCCPDCDEWSTGDVEGDSQTFDADTLHSITIIVESGTVNVSNGTENVDMIEGQSVTYTATYKLTQALTIDATLGKAIYAIITCAESTTTTELPVTTTSTEPCELLMIGVLEDEYDILEFPSHYGLN